ncbi:MAG: hypothetical protein ACHQ06_03625 [Candidatus Dormibacteria bacterium]|jgi:hypothetical protein
MANNGYIDANGVHYYDDIFMTSELARTVLPFLNGQRRSQGWADQVQAAN